jgi:hypothetical protein
VYEGEWRENGMEGMGKYQSACGDVYVGSFHENKRHGRGHMKWENGDEYNGKWANNSPHGNGKLIFNQSRSMYKGVFKRGLFHGLGGLRISEKARNWDEDAKEEKETKENRIASYHGEWSKDLRCGSGVCVGMNGATYNGGWWGNQPHGIGTMVDECGNRYSGQWENGRCHGQGKLEMANGVVYEGEFSMGLRHSRTAVQKRSLVYEFCGGFKYGLANGMGRMTMMLSDGGSITAEGEWRNGMKCGRFVVRFGDKDVRNVYFRNDVADGGWEEQMNIFNGISDLVDCGGAPPFF